MQLLHKPSRLLEAANTKYGMNAVTTSMSKRTSSDNIEVKEKNSSLHVMKPVPVASGDNMATAFNSTHKLKEDLPSLVPCCEGRELLINPDLVHTGLSAISVKHDGLVQCLSMSNACLLQVPPGLIKHRNSFRCLHRPDLKRVPYLRRMSPDELETLFRGNTDAPTRMNGKTETDNQVLTRMQLPPEDNIQARDIREKMEVNTQDEGPLHPIPERSGLEDVPAGMRLHGARARLYTSVLAGAKTGDQLDGISLNEDFSNRVTEDSLQDESVSEELRIILPPRSEDHADDCSNSSTSNN